MINRHLFARNIEAGNLLESFLVSAVASVLAIRSFLYLTGYPQLSGRGLHIAHLLWGGLLMLAAEILLLTFLSKTSKYTAAIIGGIGFGAFIDELGKFITSDNNYFFQPTIALIYTVFIILYLASRALEQYSSLSKQDALINAFELTKEAVINDLDWDERRQALNLLEKADSRNQIVNALFTMLENTQVRIANNPNIFNRIGTYLHDLYISTIKKKWFSNIIVSFFVLQSTITFLVIFIAVVGIFRASLYDLEIHLLTFVEWGELFFSAISGIIIVFGIINIHKSRLKAYLIFKRAVLVSIFLTQFFSFYTSQFVALAGLSLNILILITLQYMINQEASLERHIANKNS